MDFDVNKLVWTLPPNQYRIAADRIEMTTQPHTALWRSRR